MGMRGISVGVMGSLMSMSEYGGVWPVRGDVTPGVVSRAVSRTMDMLEADMPGALVSGVDVLVRGEGWDTTVGVLVRVVDASSAE